jgi:hypothetical protein
MFAPGDIVQFIGFPPPPLIKAAYSTVDILPLNSICTITACEDLPQVFYVGKDNVWVQHDKINYPNEWHWAFGFRLISRPDPEVLLERAPTTVKITVEELS